MTTFSIVESDGGGGWQIATINEIECRGLTSRTHPYLIRAVWVDASLQPSDIENPPEELIGKRILREVITPFIPSSPTKKQGNLETTPSVDIEAGTATYSYSEVDKTFEELYQERQTLLAPIATRSYKASLTRRAEALKKAGKPVDAIELRLKLLGG